MRFVLDFIYALALIALSPWLAWSLVRRGGWRSVPARFGFGGVRPESGTLWLHGSSVGEVAVLAPLVEALERRLPNRRLVISSFTSTGLAEARRRFGRHIVLPFPFDFSFVVRHVLGRVAPRAVIIVESELWPNFLGEARRRRLPVALLNARMSARTFRVNRRVPIVKSHLPDLAALGAQTAAHAERFVALGVPPGRIRVTGNMKYDLLPAPDAGERRAAMRAALGAGPDASVLIGASLHRPEDEAVLDCFAAVCAQSPAARLVLVPRYPHDGEVFAAHARERGFEPVLRSRMPATTGHPGSDADTNGPLARQASVLIADTLGELGDLYHAADIAFVGGSLHHRGAGKGGHNMMEPAILGIPVLFGPHTFSFRETVADLLAADAAFLVDGTDALTAAVTRLLGSAELRAGYGERARSVVLAGQGATEQSLELIAPLLPGSAVAGQPATDDNAPVRV